MWVGGWVQSQSGAGDGDQNCFTGDWSSQSPKTDACKSRSNDWSQKVEAILELEGKLIPLRKVSDVGFCKTADSLRFNVSLASIFHLSLVGPSSSLFGDHFKPNHDALLTPTKYYFVPKPVECRHSVVC